MRMFCLRFIVYALLVAGLSGCMVAVRQQQSARQQADVHYKLGLSQLESNNPTRALRELLIAVRNGPNDSAIHAALAEAYQLKKAYPQAERHYLQAIKLSKGDPRYENNLASLYLDMQQWDKAISYFDKAGSNLLFLNSHVALTGKSYAYFKKGDYPAALRQIEDVIAIAPRYARAYYIQSEVYQALGQEDKARQSLNRAVAVAPDFIPAIYQLGLMLQQDKQLTAAREKFKQVVELAPDSEWGLKAAALLRALPEAAADKN
ncbi:MAG: tetratricopeptide repeat protein [Deltaproteobacteria bacterium]|nr:tetratricopeptide repeat protein [Deltaproteobacteria bacterium]